jgi:hypothetical protein
MTGWKLLALAVGLGALGVVPLGLVAVAAPYLPGFDESFRDASGRAMEEFYGSGTFAVVAFGVGVLPPCGLALTAGLAWKALRRREASLQRRWIEGAAASADLARAWVARLSAAPEAAAHSELLAGYRLLPRLSAHQRLLLGPALQGISPPDPTADDRRGGSFLVGRMALWSTALVLLAAALLVLLLGLWAAVSNFVYLADTLPLELRIARAMAGGLVAGWWSLVLVAGAAGVVEADIARSRWRSTRERLERSHGLELRRQAREGLGMDRGKAGASTCRGGPLPMARSRRPGRDSGRSSNPVES